MVKLIIFGTSGGALKVLNNIKEEEAEIIAFADNSPQKQNTYFSWENGCRGGGEKEKYSIKILSPYEILKLEYDYVIVASTYYEIINQLVQMKIDRDKIIPYFRMGRIEFRKYKNIFYLENIYLEQLEERLEHRFKNLPYELDDLFQQNRIKRFNIRSADETMEELCKSEKSICRFGDGELGQILGVPEGYQECNNKMAGRLREVLKNPTDRCLVAIHPMDYMEEEVRSEYLDYIRGWLYKYRAKLYDLIPMDKVYYDALITRSPFNFPRFFDLFKTIWDDRDIILVEGEETRFGVGNDLLDNARSIRRILGPSKNAFDKYDEILEYCKGMDKQLLFILALGPTATILAYDLSNLGYRAIDIGHLDLEYEWYLHSEGKITKVEGKYVNEIESGDIVDVCKDPKYLSQIIKRIDS